MPRGPPTRTGRATSVPTTCSRTLPSGIVPAGATAITLTTTTSGDGYFLAGMTTAVPVPSVGLTKTVAPTYTTVGAPLPYTFTVTNTSGVKIHSLSVTDPLFGGDIPGCAHAGTLAPATSYSTCTATHTTSPQPTCWRDASTTTATVHALGEANEPLSNTASAVSTTGTNLLITKTGTPKPVHVGDPFSYQITVANHGHGRRRQRDADRPVAGRPGQPRQRRRPTERPYPSPGGGTLTATKALLTHAAPNSFTVTVAGTIA